MPTAQELERLRQEQEADADFEFAKTGEASRAYYGAEADKAIAAGKARSIAKSAAEERGRAYVKNIAAPLRRLGVLPENNAAQAPEAPTPTEPPADVTLPGAAGETTAREVKEEDLTQPVESWQRVKGMVRGAYDAAMDPLGTLQRGHEEARTTAQMAIESESVPTRILKDVGTVVMGVPKMVGTLVEPLPRGTDELKYGENIGKSVAEGVVGGTAYVVSHPVEALQAGPVSTLAQVAPAIAGAAKLAKASGIGAKLAETGAATKLAEAVAPVAEKVAEKTTGLRQALSDSRAQATPYASGVAEELSTAGKTELASQIARGVEEVTPPPTPKGSGAHFDVSHPAEGGGLLTPGKAGEVVSRKLASAEDDLRQYNLLVDATKARASANEARRAVYEARKESKTAAKPVEVPAPVEAEVPAATTPVIDVASLSPDERFKAVARRATRKDVDAAEELNQYHSQKQAEWDAQLARPSLPAEPRSPISVIDAMRGAIMTPKQRKAYDAAKAKYESALKEYETADKVWEAKQSKRGTYESTLTPEERESWNQAYYTSKYNVLREGEDVPSASVIAQEEAYLAPPTPETTPVQPAQPAQVEPATPSVSDKVRQLQRRASELRREAKELEAKAAEEVSADIRRDYEALTPEQAAAFVASEEEVRKKMTRAPEPTRPAMVVSPERATALAQDLVRQAGAAPESVPIVRDRILRYYEEHPQGPEPTATTFGTFEDGKFVPAHEVRASVPPTPAEEAAYLPIQLEARQTEKMGQVAQELAGPQTTAREVYQASLKGGMPPVLPLTKEARKFFVDRLAGLHAFAKVDAEQVARLIQHIDAMEEVGGVLVNPAIKHVLMPNGASAHPLLDAFTQWAKQSLTSQNPTAAINNFTANFALQTARVGDPITVGTRLARTAKDLYAWKAGKLDKNMSSALSFWEHSGLLDTTALGTDVAAVTGTTPLRFLRSKTLDWLYKAGDNIFKADEALSSLNKYQRYADNLKPGKTLDLEISPNVIARFTGGSDTVELMAGGKTIRTIPKQEALWRASARQAQNLFMDYSEVPGVAKWLRGMSGLSVVSPFSTYFLKAIDIPGLKKGLGYRMLETPRGIVGTTDMALAAEEAGRSLVTAAQRAAFINGMRNTLKDESNYDLRQAVSFAPAQAKLALVRQLGDPSYVGVEKMGNWNFVGPTELLFRVGVQGAGEFNQRIFSFLADNPSEKARQDLQILSVMNAASNPQQFKSLVDTARKNVADGVEGADKYLKEYLEVERELKTLSPQQLREYRHAAEFNRRLNTVGFASVDDALNLFQLAGTPITQAIDEVRKSAEMGTTVKMGRLLTNTVFPVLLGGFGKNVVNAASTYAFERGSDASQALSDYKLNDDPVLNEDDFTRYLIRKFTGVGWQKLPLEKLTAEQISGFAGKARAEWLSSLGVDKRAMDELDKLIEYRARKGQPTADLLKEKERKERVEAIVNTEMDAFGRQVDDALKATSAKRPVRAGVP